VNVIKAMESIMIKTASRNGFEPHISENGTDRRIDIRGATGEKEKIEQDLLLQQISNYYCAQQSPSEMQTQREPIRKEDDMESRTSGFQLVAKQRAQLERGDLDENRSQSNHSEANGA
jgi:hypothetical protein